MQRTIGIVLCALATCRGVDASAAHTVALRWTASVDAQASMTQNIYRANATAVSPISCPAAGTPSMAGWVQLTSGLANGVVTYTDASAQVVPGAAFCYYATSVLNGLESVPSNIASVAIPPAPPTGLSAAAN